MSETPQNPSGEPSPQPGPAPQPHYDAPAGAGTPPQGAPAAGGQAPYGAQPGQQPGQPYPGQPYAPAPLRPDEERTWAILAHLGGVLISFVAPLIVWLLFRERSRYVDAEGKEALNFQITLAIAYVASWILAGVTFGVLGFLPFLVWVVSVIFGILAAVECNKGLPYRYPVNIRLIK